MNGIGVLIVRLGDALPLPVHLEQKQHIGEVDPAAPTLLQNADDGKRLLEEQNVDARLEVLAARDGIYVVVELLDRAVLEFAVQIAEQRRLIGDGPL